MEPTLATEHAHGGIMLISSHNPDPGAIVRAVDRLLNVHDPEDLIDNDKLKRNELEL